MAASSIGESSLPSMPSLRYLNGKNQLVRWLILKRIGLTWISQFSMASRHQTRSPTNPQKVLSVKWRKIPPHLLLLFYYIWIIHASSKVQWSLDVAKGPAVSSGRKEQEVFPRSFLQLCSLFLCFVRKSVDGFDLDVRSSELFCRPSEANDWLLFHDVTPRSVFFFLSVVTGWLFLPWATLSSDLM